MHFEKPDPQAAGMSAQRLAAIPVRMREYVDAHQAAGMVTIVGRHGQVASFEAVGYQDIESPKPMVKDAMFRIASLTKPITCAGIMVLADEGKLSVIDPVEKYLPEYRGIKVSACEERALFPVRRRLANAFPPIAKFTNRNPALLRKPLRCVLKTSSTCFGIELEVVIVRLPRLKHAAFCPSLQRHA
ncbi:MAG TPA: serine hydrolase domain-containing protein [Bryobacteraceae bacterium]|nr:serine hydrolase domain-containing protein [Bryobacteraceae bacterium]